MLAAADAHLAIIDAANARRGGIGHDTELTQAYRWIAAAELRTPGFREVCGKKIGYAEHCMLGPGDECKAEHCPVRSAT